MGHQSSGIAGQPYGSSSTSGKQAYESSSDNDSWLNQKDAEDERGRVGSGWPWGGGGGK
tara:strand:+ start:100 stop:276 length:177 start_codon:yes stop_codon:yes gene_type:complete